MELEVLRKISQSHKNKYNMFSLKYGIFSGGYENVKGNYEGCERERQRGRAKEGLNIIKLHYVWKHQEKTPHSVQLLYSNNWLYKIKPRYA
jgi:hypothetical protein